jgi:peptidoglycan/LPS O-acetylase OafA/YrhL
MESKVYIIASCWVTIAMISVAMILVGGANPMTPITVELLCIVALGVTIGVMRMTEREKLWSSKPSELTSLEKKIDDLTKIVEEIKKTIEE